MDRCSNRLLLAGLPPKLLLLFAILPASISTLGCQFFKPDRRGGKEYAEMRNSVEGYQDSDGNWVRPEGARADKKRGSSAHAIAQYIPGLADKPAEPEKAKALFKEADQVFEQAKSAEGEERKKLFRSAADKYRDAGKHWISSYLEHDALMMAGESQFFAEDYPKAEQQYARVLKEYPRSRYQDLIDARRMEIAMYWLQLNETSPAPFLVPNLTDKKRPWSDTGGHGRKTLENIRLGNPTGKLSDDVTMELANAAFKKADYQSAADHYSDLRMTYPDSPHQFEAHFLGLKAVMETYQGADYNEGPLNDSEKLVKQVFKQFPSEAKEHREYLTKAYAEIRFRKAERLWSRAQWRMNRGENNSAKLFLDRILTEYSDTPFADDAKAAAAKIQDKPGEPVQSFQWLARLFADHDPVNQYLHYSDQTLQPKERSFIADTFSSWLPESKKEPSVSSSPSGQTAPSGPTQNP